MSIYKGGYITIDLGGADVLGDTPPKISGIYTKLTESYGKPVIFKNFIANSVLYDYAEMTSVYNDDGTYTYFAYLGAGIVVQVASDDTVTVTVIE